MDSIDTTLNLFSGHVFVYPRSMTGTMFEKEKERLGFQPYRTSTEHFFTAYSRFVLQANK